MSSGRILARNIQLYTAKVSSSSPRPLVVFFAWLLAKESAVQKFVGLYHRMGLDVVVASGQAAHFIAPRSGRSFVAELDRCLASCDWLDGRELFFHGTSVGAYLLTLFQMHLAEKHNGDYPGFLRGRLKGQVMDSLVYGGVDRMIGGLVDNLVRPQFLRWPAASLVGAYFRTFQGSTLEFFDRSIEFYQSRLVPSPLLFVYCDNDAMCDADALRQSLLPRMKAHGHEPIVTLHWPESLHAAHYYLHPKEYADTLESFVAQCRARTETYPTLTAKL